MPHPKNIDGEVIVYIPKQKPKRRLTDEESYRFMILFSGSLILYGLFQQTPLSLILGLKNILLSPSILISDYMQIGGVGVAFINSGILTLLNILLARRCGAHFNGPMLAGLFTVCGFSFFGKNLYNTLPIILGVYLYAKFDKKTFSHYILSAIFAQALGPAVSQITFGLALPYYFSVPLGILVGLFCGFVVPALSVRFLTFHQGFNLYNIGFTAGIIGMFITACLRIFDYEMNTVEIVASGYNLRLGIYLYLLCAILFLVGFHYNGKKLSGYRYLLKSSGKLITDFILLDGFGLTLMNMALLGAMATSYVLLVGGQLNGPSIGGIFTIMGFGAYGKHPRNSLPIMLGVYLLSFFANYHPEATSAILAALFGTTLAPIAGFYGFGYGILAGVLHMALVKNVGFLHGGINLYNNGFSGGFVALFLVPILDVFLDHRKERKNNGGKT